MHETNVTVSEQEIATLQWARKVNDESEIGLYGPTVKRTGSVPECERLVRLGFLRRYDPPPSKAMWGYWITQTGRSLLSSSQPREASKA